MRFAQIAKELREETGLSQVKLGEKLGISSSGIGHLEVGDCEPNSATLLAYAKFFDVSADYLLGLEDDFGARTTNNAAPMGDTNNAQERELLELFRTLSPYLQGLTLDTVRGWAGGAGDKSLHKKA